jgi:hypothetical protein
MIYLPGTKLICRETGEMYAVTDFDAEFTYYTQKGNEFHNQCRTEHLTELFLIENVVSKSASVLDIQEGGDHYKKLGDYQPWEVLKAWLTPEEFRGYMKGTAIAYLARERDKGEMLDIKKAAHTLQGLVELHGS